MTSTEEIPNNEREGSVLSEYPKIDGEEIPSTNDDEGRTVVEPTETKEGGFIYFEKFPKEVQLMVWGWATLNKAAPLRNQPEGLLPHFDTAGCIFEVILFDVNSNWAGTPPRFSLYKPSLGRRTVPFHNDVCREAREEGLKCYKLVEFANASVYVDPKIDGIFVRKGDLSEGSYLTALCLYQTVLSSMAFVCIEANAFGHIAELWRKVQGVARYGYKEQHGRDPGSNEEFRTFRELCENIEVVKSVVTKDGRTLDDLTLIDILYLDSTSNLFRELKAVYGIHVGEGDFNNVDAGDIPWQGAGPITLCVGNDVHSNVYSGSWRYKWEDPLSDPEAVRDRTLTQHDPVGNPPYPWLATNDPQYTRLEHLQKRFEFVRRCYTTAFESINCFPTGEMCYSYLRGDSSLEKQYFTFF